MNNYDNFNKKIMIVVFLISTVTFLNAEILNVLVEREIDDDNIIVVTSKGDRLLLNKWTMRLSPLSPEGKIFPSDVSSMWVKMYVKGKGEMKWSIEKHLGYVDLGQSQKNQTHLLNIVDI